jgi:CBS domain-containing protein
MRLTEVMTSDLPTLALEDSVREAARRMTERRVAALPVCRDEQLVGIVTDWDVTLAAASKEDLAHVPVAEVMSREVISASPNASLHDAAEIMGDCRCHHLCVTEDGRFRGMVHLEVDWMHLGAEAQAPMATFSAAL